jgi:hypothetical protein
MGYVQRTIHGIEVEMRETIEEGRYSLWMNGQPLLVLTFSRQDEHGRWVCPCGHASGKRDPMLTHVVETHLLATQRRLEERTVSLRYAGKHPDPTYDQAMLHLYGNPW